MVSGPGVQAGVNEFLAQSEDQVTRTLTGSALGEAALGHERVRRQPCPTPDTRP